ncbi:3-oxoacyl-ACP reductase FabG [Catellatospora citrea]|uniref:3-oxoacyl-ACP reductase FabG n=1 Tax=Catellatospora citrea TaxID=53366 RepID=UPI003411ACC3
MGRSVLVTGGNRGIGLAVAAMLAADGDRVAVTYNSSPPPDDLFAVKCDVTDMSSVEEAFTAVEAEQGPVQVLVSCAGITRDGLMVRMSEANYAAVIDTNLTGAFRVAQRAVRKMWTARYGRIVLVSSVVALRGETGQVNYASSKAGLIGMATSMAREFGKYGVTTNVVAPGLTHSEMSDAIKPDRREEMIRTIPAGRIGEPEDVAHAVRFLASDGAAYVNGAFLAVDGGAATGH